MEKKNWFVPKSYGWGLTPICWQGWLVTLIFIALVVAYVGFAYGLFNGIGKISTEDEIKMVFDILVWCVIFIYLMEGKTEGKVGWYWGNTKKD